MLEISPKRALQVVEPFLDELFLAAGEAGEDVALLCAVMLRESIGGTILTPPGRNGRGDGGHGRGLFQIDDRGPFRHLIPPDGEDWPVLVQARAACHVLATARVELAAFAALPIFERAVACRYNAKLENVVRELELLAAGKKRPDGRDPDPDLVTTGKDYGSDVLRLRDLVRAARPERFPPPRPRNVA
jgi:hypothetical protein